MRMSAAALCLLLIGFSACNRSEKEAANITPAEVVRNENPPATATEARVEGRSPATARRSPSRTARLIRKAPRLRGRWCSIMGR